MIIDLKKFFSSAACTDTVIASYEMKGVEINGVQPFAGPVSVTALLKSEIGAVGLYLTLEYRLRLPCDRCFEEAVIDSAVEKTHMLVRELREEDDEDLYVLVPEDQLDLDELVYADVLLSLPSKFLCKETCKGLCPHCGTNQNISQCTCENEKIDPRLEALKQFLK